MKRNYSIHIGILVIFASVSFFFILKHWSNLSEERQQFIESSFRKKIKSVEYHKSNQIHFYDHSFISIILDFRPTEMRKYDNLDYDEFINSDDSLIKEPINLTLF